MYQPIPPYLPEETSKLVEWSSESTLRDKLAQPEHKSQLLNLIFLVNNWSDIF